MSALLEVRDLVIEYAGGDYPVRPIDGLDLTADAGELVVLLGPSGCGKTSLLSALGGILRPTEGIVSVAGRSVGGLTAAGLTSYRQRQVGFVFQAFNLVPSLTARENVAMPLMLAGTAKRAAMARADELMERVGLVEQANRRPSKLSGGQQQRVAVARGLAADPPLLLADEPTANLDYVHAEGIIQLLRSLRADGRLIVISTHDDRLVPIADRVVKLVPDAAPVDSVARYVELAAGEVVFEQGTRAENVYVVESGTVLISRRRADGSSEELATVAPGAYFGELGPLLGFPRSATATAATDVRLRAIGITDFRSEFVDATAGAGADQPPGATP